MFRYYKRHLTFYLLSVSIRNEIAPLKPTAYMKIIPFESPDDESGDELPIHMQEKILSHPAIIGAG